MSPWCQGGPQKGWLCLTSLERVTLLGFDGTSSTAEAFELEMTFAGRAFRGRFLLMDGECGILGRNILNSVSILHDGPRLTWDVR